MKDALFFPILPGGMGEPNAEVKVVNEETGISICIIWNTFFFFLVRDDI